MPTGLRAGVMYFVALATDYDGTLAEDGRVDRATLKALESLHASGRKLILVTGRELGDLRRLFPEISLFTMAVAENGGLLYEPSSNKASGLAAALARLKLSPLNVVRLGDAENDHAFLHACGCAAAIANASLLVAVRLASVIVAAYSAASRFLGFGQRAATSGSTSSTRLRVCASISASPRAAGRRMNFEIPPST
jgi:hydroxymethylpyrimidine pyrophosphatase-like HAD family hydrolase